MLGSAWSEDNPEGFDTCIVPLSISERVTESYYHVVNSGKNGPSEPYIIRQESYTARTTYILQTLPSPFSLLYAHDNCMNNQLHFYDRFNF